jgi:hypothetical protein
MQVINAARERTNQTEKRVMSSFLALELVELMGFEPTTF